MTVSVRMPTKRMIVGAVAVVFAAAGPLAGCGSSDSSGSGTTTTGEGAADGASGITVTDAWARPGSTGGNDALYMTIKGGDTDDALTGVEVPGDVAAKAEIHETTMDDGTDSDDMDHDSDDMDHGDMGSDGADSEDTDHGATDDGDTDDGDTEEGKAGGSGMMTMKPVDSLSIPAGGTVELEPGGYHIMMFDLKKDLAVGDSIQVTLDFDEGATQTLTAEVRES